MPVAYIHTLLCSFDFLVQHDPASATALNTPRQTPLQWMEFKTQLTSFITVNPGMLIDKPLSTITPQVDRGNGGAELLFWKIDEYPLAARVPDSRDMLH